MTKLHGGIKAREVAWCQVHHRFRLFPDNLEIRMDNSLSRYCFQTYPVPLTHNSPLLIGYNLRALPKNWFFRQIVALRGVYRLAHPFDMLRCCAPCALRFIPHNRIFRGIFVLFFPEQPNRFELV